MALYVDHLRANKNAFSSFSQLPYCFDNRTSTQTLFGNLTENIAKILGTVKKMLSFVQKFLIIVI